MNEKKYVLGFIRNLCDKKYSEANKSLQKAVNEKLKKNIRNCLQSADKGV